jgi:hypothetical protein
VEIHHDHVGRERGGLRDRLVAVRRLADDLDPLQVAEDRGQAGAEHRVVVGDEDPHSGSLA